MKQEGYVNADGAPVVHQQIDKKTLLIRVSIVTLVLFLIVFIFIVVQKSNKNKKCNGFENTFSSAALSYAKEKKILPVVEGKAVKVNIDDLIKEGKIASEQATNKEEACHGTVTITRYQNDYHTAVEVTGCGSCATEKRYGNLKESDKMPSGHAYVELIPTYNYYTTETNYGMWTDYLTPEKIDTKKDKKYKMNLPLNPKVIPSTPTDAKDIVVEQEQKNYYRYRDKKWKFYRNASANCSEYTSEQPAGYTTKDSNSRIDSATSEWSLSYPDRKDYRRIYKQTGYRWYYMDGKNKIYWKNGKYAVEQPEEKYTEKDNKSTMYSYVDSLWRWCNGDNRHYTSYTSETPKSAPYRDDQTITLGTWSQYREISALDASNSYYREEEIQVRTRFRYQYKIYSLHQLDRFMTASEFEQTTKMPLEQFINLPNVKVDVKYKYKYRK